MRIELTGKRALFARPELRAERVSYEAPTPSAMEGVLKSIYWKPEMQYHIKKIYVLKKPKYESVMTNSLIRKGVVKPGFNMVYGGHSTTPRSMLILKDVHYIVEFTISRTGLGTRPDDTTEKHVSVFDGRAKKGECFREPSLGAKEFSCDFRLLSENEEIPESENKGVKMLGRMLHHIDRSGEIPVPVFYNPIMRDGVIDVNESMDGYVSEGWLFQNLVGFYDRMKDRYDFPEFGYSNAKIYYEAVLNREGEMVKFGPLHVTEKGKLAPSSISVPDAEIRTSNDAPNFLWDNETYVFGNGKSGPERKKLFADKIKAVMGGIHDPGTDAVLRFLENTDYAALENMIEPYLTVSKGEGILNGSIVFRLEDEDDFIHNHPAVKEKWENYFHSHLTGKKGYCIITGEYDYLTQVHPLIKGSSGSSGMAKLISIDGEATAFEFSNLKKMENSPISRRTTHKYSVVLNWMLSRMDHKVDVTDETFVFWSENDNPALLKALQKALGKPVDEEIPFDEITYGEKYYIVGIKASTKGRLYIAHYQDFVYGDNSKSAMKEFLAMITKSYTDTKIKPCYTIIERWEEDMGETEKKKRKAYLLGGLQACIEKAQKDAITSTRNAGTPTISDRYIHRASETPAAVFPEMLKMAQVYTTKVDYGMKRKIGEFLSELNQYDEPFPARLTPSEKCDFFIGYYETNSTLYTKKNTEE